MLVNVLIITHSSGISIKCSDNQQENAFCLPKNYSKYEIPHKDRPNQVGVGIQITEILNVDIKDYSVTMALFLDISWRDPRVVMEKDLSKAQGEDSYIPHPVDLIDQLWVPDIFVYNVSKFASDIRNFNYVYLMQTGPAQVPLGDLITDQHKK